jgi:hypothetical protein
MIKGIVPKKMKSNIQMIFSVWSNVLFRAACTIYSMCNAKDIKESIRMGTMNESTPAIITASEGSLSSLISIVCSIK